MYYGMNWINNVVLSLSYPMINVWCCCISPSYHYISNDIFGVDVSLHHTITYPMIYLVFLHISIMLYRSIMPLPIQLYIWRCCISPSYHYISNDIFGVAVSLHHAIWCCCISPSCHYISNDISKKKQTKIKIIKIKGTPNSTATWISRNNANKKWCCCISPSCHYPSNDMFGVSASLHHAITYPMIYLVVLLHLSIVPLPIQWYIWCCCISPSFHYLSNDIFGVAASFHHAITYPVIYLVLLYLSIVPLHIQW